MSRGKTNEGGGASVAAAGGAGERRPGLRAAGLAAARVVVPIVARRGGGAAARLKAEWAAIVGPELADSTWPVALGRDGALKLTVRPGRAVEVQHRAPLVIERVNLFLGRAAATRLALVQGLPPLPPARRRRPDPTIGAADAAQLETRLEKIDDAELRAALARLGRAVIALGG